MFTPMIDRLLCALALGIVPLCVYAKEFIRFATRAITYRGNKSFLTNRTWKRYAK